MTFRQDYIIETSKETDIDRADMRELWEALELCNEAISMKEFKIVKAPSGVYDYEFTTRDGRTWKQDIRYREGRVEMNFSVPDFWTLEEFSPHRPVRDIVARLVKRGLVTRIKRSWT